jgi:hypothetical protein
VKRSKGQGRLPRRGGSLAGQDFRVEKRGKGPEQEAEKIADQGAG